MLSQLWLASSKDSVMSGSSRRSSRFCTANGSLLGEDSIEWLISRLMFVLNEFLRPIIKCLSGEFVRVRKLPESISFAFIKFLFINRM